MINYCYMKDFDIYLLKVALYIRNITNIVKMYLCIIYLQDDRKEGMSAFVDKRAAEFKDNQDKDKNNKNV